MRITTPTSWLRYDHVGLWGLILWSDCTAASSLAPTALVAWLRPDMSCQQGAPEATFGRRRGSRSSAGAERGEIIAGVHGEGNVPLSVRPCASSSAYHYPLKEGSNCTNGRPKLRRELHGDDVCQSARSPSIFESNHINNGCGFINFPLWTRSRGQGSFYSNTVSQHRKLNTTQTQTNIINNIFLNSFNTNINPVRTDVACGLD